MRANLEKKRADSCINRALPDEMTFVLLGRDAAAPVAIRAWCDERVRSGKSKKTDPQIVEAELCADTMDREHFSIRSEIDLMEKKDARFTSR